jgi:hypothetical protein
VIHEWTHATISINGQPLECVAASYEQAAGRAERKPCVSRTYETECTIYLDAKQSARWLALLEDYRRYMQRFAMLMKRTQYGGRKGRRAWRRLAEMQR